MLARRVLLVADHPVFRTGLRRVLEATGRYEVVAEAGNAHEAIRAAEETRPGLILLDVQLPGITGLRITRILRRKQTRARIVVISVHVAGTLSGTIKAADLGQIDEIIEPRETRPRLIRALEVWPSFPLLERDLLAVGEVFLEIFGQSRSQARIENGKVDFIVDGEGPAVEVCRAYNGPHTVDDQNFGMDHSGFVLENLCSSFQYVSVQAAA